MFLVGLTVRSVQDLSVTLHYTCTDRFNCTSYLFCSQSNVPYCTVLQGGVATGKSTVSNMFREAGVPVIDADAMARRIVEPGRKAWRAIK